MLKKKAFITGITGQDGSYLAELLLSKGYEVHGMIRRSSTINTLRLAHLYEQPQKRNRSLFLHYGDISDTSRLFSLLASIAPDEIYNLAAQSHVKVSFEEPVLTGETTGLGSTKLLEAVISLKLRSKFYQASSSEMFGASKAPQNETSSFKPKSPYAVAKLYAHWMVENYREAHGIFAVSGILFNHESPRRGETFLTRKVSQAVSKIVDGKQEELFLGDLRPMRDWGYAPDYVVAMWRMLQKDEPKDFAVGTGLSATVEDFVRETFAHAGLDYKNHVRFEERYVRPNEVEHLEADAGKARSELGLDGLVTWRQLSSIMLEHDMAITRGSSLIDTPNSALWKLEAGN